MFYRVHMNKAQDEFIELMKRAGMSPWQRMNADKQFPALFELLFGDENALDRK